ncbi:MAG: hypothetical protein KDE63_00845 [Novosphingobium sp.]|nr:hypothetical protein [Novosphingobium sp.]
MTMAIAAAFVAGACSPSPTPTGEGAATSERAGTAQPQRPGLNHAAIEAWLAARFQGLGDLPYAVKGVDLNGDGRDEAVIYLSGPATCGSGGCSAYVLTPQGTGYRAVMDASVTRAPITVLDSSTNGWRDLTVDVGGGGGPSGHAKMTFDGSSYPSNPTVAPARMTDKTGTVLIPENPEMQVMQGEDGGMMNQMGPPASGN